MSFSCGMAQKPSQYKAPSQSSCEGRTPKGIRVPQGIAGWELYVSSNEWMSGTILSGIAGEYFVAGELSRRGYIATLTLRNTTGVDIIASNGSRAINIQVKTRTEEKAKDWDLGSRPLKIEKEWDNTFYIFVRIYAKSDRREVEYYVIPKNQLNRAVERSFRSFLGRANTKQTIEKGRRRFRLREHPQFKEYKDKWDLLFKERK